MLRRTQLKRVGKDKAREAAKYRPLRKVFLERTLCCEFHNTAVLESNGVKHLVETDTCFRKPTQIHHMKGQHWRVMNDTKFWMGLCAQHHAWIHDNAKEARKRGLILYK